LSGTDSPGNEPKTSPPLFSRGQIVQFLIKDIVMSKMKMEQPAIFEKFVQWAFGDQSRELDLSKGPTQLMMVAKDIINKRLASATNSTIATAARTEFHRLRFFAAQDPRVCVADYFGDDLSSGYETAVARMPTWLRGEIIGMAADLLFTQQSARQADEAAAQQIRARSIKRNGR
jgi:hypothetical protein